MTTESKGNDMGSERDHARGVRFGLVVAAVALTLSAGLSSGCAPAGVRPAVGAVRVHTSATNSSDTLTVSLRTTTGQLVRQASGPGHGWDASFPTVPAGRYVVQLQIDEPSTQGPNGVVTSSSILTQAPSPVVVERGSSTYLVYDGTSWTAVQ